MNASKQIGGIKMDAGIEGRIAIVTGGSRGIGREVCLLLARHRASVVVNYQGNHQKAQQVVSLIRDAGGEAIAVQADVTSPSQVSSLFEQAEVGFCQEGQRRKVHMVVHMAGTATPEHPLIEDTAVEEWDEIMAVNARGTFLVCRKAARRVVQGGGGRIVTCSSIAMQLLMTGYCSYIASKAAVEAITKVLAKEMKGRKITVNAVSPGAVVTELFFAVNNEASIENFRTTPALERLGETKDIASLVLFLVSDAGEWVNGQVIRADGGLCI